jgi:hypothetical protein
LKTHVYTNKLPLAVVAKGECAVKKIFKTTAGLTPVILVLTLFCSNPVKDVAWRTSIDLPITANKKFLLGAMMDTLFFNKQQVATTTTIDTSKTPHDTTIDTTMKIINAYPEHDTIKHAGKPDTIVTVADTVQFGFPTKDSASDTISEDSLADKTFSDVFGPIPIIGAPSDSVSVPLAGNFIANTPVTTPGVPLTLKLVYHIELMDTPQTMNVTVVNNSAADFSSVQLTAGTFGTSTINTLLHNTTATAQFNARAKVIDSVITVSLTVAPSTSGTFGATDNFGIIFSPNGLVASKVVVNDYLLAGYQRTFTNEYKLTDTVSVNYIDIDKGFFIYSVTNNSNLNLLLSVVHRHLWRTDFCQQQNPPLVSVSQLVNLTKNDSDNASNCKVVTNERILSHQTDSVGGQQHNISATRLFAEWDPDSQESVTKIDYIVGMDTAGKRVTLSAGDSMKFVIRTTSFKFKELSGVSMDEYHRTGTPSNIPVKLPWSKAVTDSLRNHFILNKVLAKTLTRITIPQGALIDTVHIHYDIASSVDSTIKTSSDAVLLHVTKDSLFERTVDITNVVNNYPDSVRVNISLTIPVQTRIIAENDLTDPTDLPAYNEYIGRMVLHGNVNYNLVAPLCWTVVDTTIMDLGGTKVDLTGGSGVLNIFNDMTDRHASLNVKVTNSTNVYLRLFALVATADTNQVDSLTDTGYVNVKAGTRYVNTNEFTDLIKNPTPGFVNLLGGGLLIPPRDSTYTNSIALGDSALEKITSAKEIGWRWQVRFLPQPAGVAVPDALSNTDWIKLNSWIHVDGVNSINKLIK